MAEREAMAAGAFLAREGRERVGRGVREGTRLGECLLPLSFRVR